ncbi:sensor histidine kinase [Curtobacterium luteum]|uniref:sensor histidine kinase n=1 Tax=Curtobacterium luteum TaxID=33881 RepID=UPI0037F738F8
MTEPTTVPGPGRPGRARFARVGRVLPVALLQVVGTLVASRWAGGGPTGPPWLAHGDGAPVEPVVLGPLALTLLVGGIVVLPFRWWRPRGVLWIVAATTFGYAAVVTPRGPFVAALTMALANAWSRGRRVDVLVVAVVAVAWLPSADAVVGRAPGIDLGAVLIALAWVVVTLAVTELVRVRSERVAERRRAREEAARRRADEERVRIARELHDSVAHSMSLINLQSGVALHLGADLPEPTQRALEHIRDTSRQALVELRTILGVLRSVDGEPGSERNPTPGLDRLPDLVTRARAAGITVDAVVVGDADVLDGTVQRNAYRIVQEALTNVMKHAPANRAAITVRIGPDAVDVVVEDEPVGPDPAGRHAPPIGDAGNGLIGMRERATAVGGSFRAGPQPGGGWRVVARLPHIAHTTDTSDATDATGIDGIDATDDTDRSGR